MDFSHIVNFADVTLEGRPADTIDVVKQRLQTLDQDHTTEVFDQSIKLRKLHNQKTQQMVYVILYGVSVPIPEKLSRSHRHTTAVGDFSLENFNSIAGDIPITILSTVPNCEEVYMKTCDKHNVVCNVKKFIPIDGFGIRHLLEFNTAFEKPNEPNTNCNYLFHTTNGRTKLPRLLMMEELWNRKLLDKSMWSWHVNNIEDQHVDPATAINPAFNFPYKQNKPLDEPTWFTSKVFEQVPPSTPKGYDDCYIDIMSETIDEPHAIWITEKTMRSYMYLKPSLQLNNFGHYEYLKSIGIQLYEELFDYDIIEKPSLKERIKGIADNLSRLAQYSKSTMDNKILQIKDKLIHNRQVLLNMQIETFPTAEIGYLLSHNIVPNDLNTAKRVSTIGTQWINKSH